MSIKDEINTEAYVLKHITLELERTLSGLDYGTDNRFATETRLKKIHHDLALVVKRLNAMCEESDPAGGPPKLYSGTATASKQIAYGTGKVWWQTR
jgi:hypothetical protein